MERRSTYVATLIVLLIATASIGCSPRLSPLYRDFSITEIAGNDRDIYERLTLALEEAGWSVIDGVTPNIVATEGRDFNSWGIYTMEVELEASPVGKGYVRLFIHPYRRYFTGSRGKMPYLKRGLAKAVMSTLETPFEAYGLKFAGTAESRDRAYRQNGS
ncbi:MAG: hypothetical protein BMS9Abin05_1285 [Rhodothermia bacterium]|nr:MAG: hypothetical protein BMS9Abin05_1285 [Rhodothermia bacterium]